MLVILFFYYFFWWQLLIKVIFSSRYAQTSFQSIDVGFWKWHWLAAFKLILFYIAISLFILMIVFLFLLLGKFLLTIQLRYKF